MFPFLSDNRANSNFQEDEAICCSFQLIQSGACGQGHSMSFAQILSLEEHNYGWAYHLKNQQQTSGFPNQNMENVNSFSQILSLDEHNYGWAWAYHLKSQQQTSRFPNLNMENDKIPSYPIQKNKVPYFLFYVTNAYPILFLVKMPTEF